MSDSVKVLHVLDHSLPHRSGYAIRSRAIINNQRRIWLNPVVLTSPRHGEIQEYFSEIEGIGYYRSDAAVDRPRKGMAAWPGIREHRQMRYMEQRILEVARQEKVDVIHAHSPSLNGIPAYRAARRLGIPVVYEIRAFWEDAAVDQGKFKANSVKYRLSRMMETWLVKRVDQVTVICHGLRNELISRGVPGHKVSVTPNGVDMQEFATLGNPEQIVQQYGLQDQMVLGFIGSFYHYEGLQLLIDAMARLAPTHPNLKLLLVGDGEMVDPIRAQIETLGLQKSVILTGSVPPTVVRDYYAAMDIMVYPRLSERITNLVTPLKPLEAMALRKLVIGSDVGGIAELVDGERTGYLFRANSCDDLVQTIQRALLEKDRWPEIIAAAHQYVTDERQWLNVAHIYQSVYERAIAGKRPQKAAVTEPVST